MTDTLANSRLNDECSRQGYWHPDPDYPGWYTRQSLSDGQTLLFSAVDYDGDEVYDLEMLVLEDDYPDYFGEDYGCAWAKEGTPTGPGGTEVFGLAAGLLLHMEFLIGRQGGEPIFRAGGATPRLMRLYEHFLSRHGYTRVVGSMLKAL